MPHDYEDRELTFFQKHRLLLCTLIALIIGGVVYGLITLSKNSKPAKKETIAMVTLAPPPPPPKMTPPPPPPEQKIEEKQEIQEPKPEDKPKEEPPKNEPPPSLGTNLKGDGNDGFGLSGNGNGGMVGGNGNGNGQWTAYASKVQQAVANALRTNDRTRAADFHLDVRVWADASGRVTRAALASSTGDPALDSVIQNNILTGLRLADSPPDGMPMPIHMRLTARRPN